MYLHLPHSSILEKEDGTLVAASFCRFRPNPWPNEGTTTTARIAMKTGAKPLKKFHHPPPSAVVAGAAEVDFRRGGGADGETTTTVGFLSSSSSSSSLLLAGDVVMGWVVDGERKREEDEDF